MHVVDVSDLPAGEGSRSSSLEAAALRFESTGEVPLRQLSLHLAPEMVTEWLEGER